MTPGRNSHSIHLQQRDFTLLAGLLESRVMTITHIATLYFEGRREAAKKRIQKLKSAHLLHERSRRPFESSVLSLTVTGVRLLQSEGYLAGFPKLSIPKHARRTNVSDLMIRHELAVVDIKCSFAQAVRERATLRMQQFATWPTLYQFTAHSKRRAPEVIVKPDGFLQLSEERQKTAINHHFFLEVDRSTESQRVLMDKALCYIDFYRSGGFAVRFGGSPKAFAQFPFRVLMVLKSQERLYNTALRLLACRPPILSQVWMTTMSQVLAAPLGPIWVRPRDCRGTAGPKLIRRVSLLAETNAVRDP